MGGKSKKFLQRWVIKIMSDGNVWTNREIYDLNIEHFKGGMRGFASWMSCHSMLGQMARSTNRRVSETHEIVRVGEGRLTLNQEFKDSQKYVEYILQ